jgi:phytoene dehydrogenase-like protein
MQKEFDIAVVGGGLAGLAAATCAARAGRRVVLFEKASGLGGRGVTHEEAGFRFNLGPHALYRRGVGAAVLRELGVRFTGASPASAGNYAVAGGVKHALPSGFFSLLTTGLLRLPGKLEIARLLGTLQKIDAAALARTSAREWLARALRQPDARSFVQALFRLSTYANDPERQSAGVALGQLQLALTSNVLYLDGGWQTLVDGLRAAAEAAGVRVETATRTVAIDHDGAVRAVRLADGSRHPIDAAILATPPAEAAGLVDAPALSRWAADAVPVRAACLDVGLSRLPDPRARFALGVDRPLYLSVHSAVARLAPAGAATIHVAKYLGPADGGDPKADERELEGLLDLVQPGWRPLIAARRFLPGMVVTHALTTAAAGGATGRPGPAVPGVRNLYVAGDWVGPEGLLADASFASARQAARLAAAADGAAVAAA